MKICFNAFCDIIELFEKEAGVFRCVFCRKYFETKIGICEFDFFYNTSPRVPVITDKYLKEKLPKELYEKIMCKIIDYKLTK